MVSAWRSAPRQRVPTSWSSRATFKGDGHGRCFDLSQLPVHAFERELGQTVALAALEGDAGSFDHRRLRIQMNEISHRSTDELARATNAGHVHGRSIGIDDVAVTVH